MENHAGPHHQQAPRRLPPSRVAVPGSTAAECHGAAGGGDNGMPVPGPNSVPPALPSAPPPPTVVVPPVVGPPPTTSAAAVAAAAALLQQSTPTARIFGRNANGTIVATSAPANEAELQLYRVMQRASLLAYYDTLLEMGGDDVQQLCEAGEEEFLEIMALVGMASKPLHVRRLQKALQEWVGNPAPFQTPLVPGGPAGPLVFPPPATAPRAIPGSVVPSPITPHTAPPPPTSPGHQALRGHPFLVVAPPQVSVPTANPVPPPPPPPPVHTLPQSPRPPVSPAAVPQTQAPEATPTTSAPSSGPSPSHASPGSSSGEAGPSSPPDAPSSPQNRTAPRHVPPASSQGCWFGSEESSGEGSGWPPPCSPESPPPGGQPVLLEAQVARLAEAAERLARCLPPFEPRPHNAKKRICRDLEAVMAMSEDDPRRMDEIRKYAAIYGRFDCKRKPEKQLTLHEVSVNEAAAQICKLVPALLSRRDELFPLARQVVRDSGYQYSKGASHPSSAACPSDSCSGGRAMCLSGANGTTLPAEDHGGLHSGKRPRSEVGEGSPTRMAKRLQESAGEVGTAAAEAASSSSARARSPQRSGAAEAGSRATRPIAPSEHHRTPIGWCHRRSGRVSSSSSCIDPERPDTDDTDSGGSSPYQMVRETLMDEGLRVVREMVSGRGRDGSVETGAGSPTQESFFHENKVIASSGNNIIAVANPALSMSPAIHSPPADSAVVASVPVALVKREPPSPTYE